MALEWVNQHIADFKAKKAKKRQERADKKAEKDRVAGLKEEAKTYADGAIDAATQERVGIEGSKRYFFPIDFEAKSEDLSIPFIRFGISQNKGNEKVSVYLFQPNALSISDGANYSSFDMGSLKGGFDAAMTAYRSKTAPEINHADMMSVAILAKDSFRSDKIGKITSNAALQAGVATNPYTRSAYESTNVRTFGFTFKLIAKNETESIAAMDIERTFRKFLYPKRSGSIALTYPPTFHIEFYYGGDVNQFLPKIKPCYLTSLETTFNETASHMHTEGQPVEVNLSLAFQEERVLVRQDLFVNDDTTQESDEYYNPGGTNTIVKGVD